MVNHKGSPPSLSKSQLPRFKFGGSKSDEEDEEQKEPRLEQLEQSQAEEHESTLELRG